MLASRRLLLGCLAVVALLPLLAQEPKFTADTGRRLALVVGVRQYEKSDELAALKYTENDAHQLADVLTRAGYKVVVLTQKESRAKEDIFLAPTAKNIRRELDTLLHPDKRTEADTALVAFSGHGVQLQSGKEHYLCPQDADLDDTKTLIALGEVYERMDKCKAGLKLLFTDACRNDPKDTKGAKFAAKVETKPSPQKRDKPGGVASFFSCSAGQFSYESDKLEHGLFFHFLIEGFKGKGANSKGQVTLESLASYVKSQVDDQVKELLGRDKDQMPHLVSDVRGSVPLTVVAAGEAEREEDFDYYHDGERKRGKRRVMTLDLGNGVKLELVRIPRGKFMMGSPNGEKRRRSDEEQHEVDLTRDFWMGKLEVTRGQFRAFVKDTGYETEAEKGDGAIVWNATNGQFEQNKDANWKNVGFEQTDEHPVVCVSWNDAVEFTRWLAKKSGKTVRLPTEAEWEYACRAGTTTRFYCGDDEERLALVGNVADGTAKKKFARWTTMIKAEDGYVFTAPGGKFLANRFGLHDMHGNASEWCADYYGPRYNKIDSKTDPIQDQPQYQGDHRVLRGGSWGDSQDSFWDCRAAARSRFEPGFRNGVVGFRVCVPAARTP
jgi:formylglycine-generating enzyme required for sulfatase activity